VTSVFLGLGTNLGDRAAHLAHALARLAEELSVTGVSSVYETDPVGFADQPRFLNMVVRAETARSPDELLALTRGIEAERGREREFRDSPRTLDVDVLLYGDHQVRLEGLTVPHPRMAARPFVLVPLLELAPSLAEPGTGRPYRELLAAAGGALGVRKVLAPGALIGGEAR
jgi:2-amino-4-hydroxy-6-hydroxymethyldihydropteridine diphosphokinase